jgi:hypothetical protein
MDARNTSDKGPERCRIIPDYEAFLHDHGEQRTSAEMTAMQSIDDQHVANSALKMNQDAGDFVGQS